MNIRESLSRIERRRLSRLYLVTGYFFFFVIFLAQSSRGKELLPEPTYDNTFYLFFGDGYRGSSSDMTTYNEDWPHGVLDYRYQLEKLKEILSRVGPDGPYLRIGMADALWPTRAVWAGDWSYAGQLGLSDDGKRGDDQFPEARSGPDPYFNNTIMPSWAAVDMPGILFLNSMNMVAQEWAHFDSFTADPGNLTAFLEQHADAVQRYDDNRISISDDLDGLHEPTDYVEDTAFSGNAPKGTMLTFSRLMSDSLRNGYLKRNIQAAMEHVMAINAHYPGLIVAVSIEAENDMNAVRCHQGECDFWADFCPLAIEEWRQWLSHTDIYGPDGAFEGQGAQPWFPTVADFNAATGSSFSSWSQVDPRDVEHAGPGVWDMYLDGGDMDGEWSPGNPPGSGHEQGWCEVMVEHRCEDSVDWLWEIAQTNGWNRSQVFTHQVPGGFVDEALNPDWTQFWGYEHRLCTLAATAVANGRPGITGFRENTMNPDLFRVLHEELSIDGAWANLEFNPLRAKGYFPGYDNDYDVWIDAYEMNWEWGAHMLAAFRWWLPPEANTSWANIRPEFHPEQDPSIDFEARLRASHDFVSNNDHRFNPWSPEGGSIDENDDFLPPTPSLTAFKYDIQDETISLAISPEIFAENSRLLWYDTVRHELWPAQLNVFGWPEFTKGHFNIHRDTIPDFELNAFNLTAIIDVPLFAFTDSSLPLSGGIFYAVVAVDNQGDKSPEPVRDWVTSRIAFPYGNSLAVELNQDASTDTFVVVANDGERVLTIGSVTADVQWLVVVDAPDAIEPGMEDSILIRISPEGLAAGEHSGSLLILSNDPFDPQRSVHITLNVSLGAVIPLPGPGELTVNPLPTARLISVSWLCGFPGEGVTVELVDLAGRTVHAERILSDEDGMVRHHFRLAGTVGDGAYVLRLSTEETAVQKRIIVLD